MLRRVLFACAIPAMALGAVLMSSAPTFARPHGHGGGGWGGHGGGWGGGYRGGWGGGYYGRGWDRGWGGFGLGYGLGYLSGSYGWPGYYGGYGYGYPGYAYSGYYSYPAYSYGTFDYGTPAYSYPSTGYYTEQPAMVQQPNVTDYSSAYNGFNSQPAQDANTAQIDVRVPANAQVWFDGATTRQTGSFREFISPPLQPNQEYTYTIRARWMQNGQPVDQTRSIQVAANERRSVNFLAPNNNALPPAGGANATFGTEPNPAPNANFAPNPNIAPNTQFAPNSNVPANPNVVPNNNLPPNTNVAPNTNVNPNNAPANADQPQQTPASRPNTTTAPRRNPVP
jgi:uncharacterized protein (TIGR03000 family)